MTSLVELDHRKRADKSNFRKLEDILGLLMLIGMTVLVSLRTTGVPGVGLIVLSMVFNQVGLPIEGIALIMGVDRLLDMMRTGAVNVTSDATVTTIVARGEDNISMTAFNDPDAGVVEGVHLPSKEIHA